MTELALIALAIAMPAAALAGKLAPRLGFPGHWLRLRGHRRFRARTTPSSAGGTERAQGIPGGRAVSAPPGGALRRLSALSLGETGAVAGLGPDCGGLARRRLLDMGLTPGAQVRVALDNTFGDPRAFEVRGTTIALRRRQADQIWIRARRGPRNAGRRP